MIRILISMASFGVIDSKPIDFLKNNSKCEFINNPLGRRLKENELIEMIRGINVVIAGTEPITRRVMDNAPELKLISRVGVGLDSVDILAAREKGVIVSYTPDAPSAAVAELTISHILNLLRNVSLVDRKFRNGEWNRFTGERLANQVVGIIGCGRIGSKVLKHLQGFEPKRILVNDIKPNEGYYKSMKAELVEKEKIYRESDIITLHVPLTPQTRNMIRKEEMEKMKENVYLINTSRGGIINEEDLYEMLEKKRIGGAGLDVFSVEPYTGPLLRFENCVFSCHMGSMTKDCRVRMELEAVEEALRFVNGEKLLHVIPEEEYLK